MALPILIIICYFHFNSICVNLLSIFDLACTLQTRYGLRGVIERCGIFISLSLILFGFFKLLDTQLLLLTQSHNSHTYSSYANFSIFIRRQKQELDYLSPHVLLLFIFTSQDLLMARNLFRPFSFDFFFFFCDMTLCDLLRNEYLSRFFL